MRKPREVVNGWIGAFNRADADALAAMYAEGATNYQVMWEPLVGRTAIR